MNTSPKLLFSRLSNPGGLSEWFADNVILERSLFCFFWDGNKQKAKQTYIRENSIVRYEWIDDEEHNYFEFRLKTDELTGELALIVTDFAEDDEKNDIINLWNNQISKLKRVIGL